MEIREFGNTGIKVSLPGFGAGHIGSAHMDELQASRLLNRVLDLGINLIDTARSYGESERRIGEHLSHRRHEFILSTKVGYTFNDQPDWSYEATMGTIEEALVQMRTDYLDIAHLHSCDKMHLEQGDSILALEEAKRQGKVRIIAYSGENEALALAIDSGRFDSIQCSVNIFDQQGLEKHLPAARQKGMGIIAKRPLGNAVWRYHARPEGHGHAAYWDRMLQMQFDRSGFEWNELALRFSSFSPCVDTLIIGSDDPIHLKENIAMIERGPLPQAIWDMIRNEFNQKGQDWSGLI
jgi:aryl-alcohol dehydrogenase-like predicted oxidoreductase